MSRIALTRVPSPYMDDCELTFRQRIRVNADLLSRQHSAYEETLRRLGCDIVAVDPTPRLPDSVFVEDTAVVLDEIFVMTRPGAPSRRPEVDSVAKAMNGLREIVYIEPPGTLDGGDVLVVGRCIYVGASTRLNRSGFDQIASIGDKLGYSVVPIELTGCLHLKSAATLVASNTLLVNPDYCTMAESGHRLIPVSNIEPDAANALLIADRIIYPMCFPETAEILQKNGIVMEVVNVSEIQKAEGGVTCCSIVFES